MSGPFIVVGLFKGLAANYLQFEQAKSEFNIKHSTILIVTKLDVFAAKSFLNDMRRSTAVPAAPNQGSLQSPCMLLD